MASWFDSLESVSRLQHLVLWIAVVSAIVAAVSGVFSYLLSNRVSALRNQETRQLEAARAEAEKEVAADREALEQTQQALAASEERAATLADRIDELEGKIDRTSASRRQEKTEGVPPASDLPPQARPTEDSAKSGRITDAQKRKLEAALAGQVVGEITLVVVAGDAVSLALAQDLGSLVGNAGWTPEQLEALFRIQPQGFVFVVRDQESIPERQVVLAKALAEAGLLQPPAKMVFNPNRPPGYLGLIVGPPKP